MRINEVERQIGITKKNIRFYEEQGLLSPRRNKENGYREYDESDINTLNQIKFLRKLGLPLEEIRLMQAGSSTVADSMKRHLVTLEREERNLHQSMEFCNMLKSEEKILQDLPVESLLLEMEDMEKRGTSFSNKQEWDVKPYYYVMPTIIALGMTVLMGGLIWLLVDMFIDEPEEAPPLPVEVVMVLAMFLVIVGVLLAFVQRIKEIRKGEAEDAKKY